MNAYRFFSILRAGVILGMLLLIGFAAGIAFVCREISREVACRSAWGQNWEAKYQESYGSLSNARVKAGICLVGVVAVVLLAVNLVHKLNHRRSRLHRRRELDNEKEMPSTHDRITRLRRKGFWSLCLGFAGLVGSLCFVLLLRPILDELSLNLSIAGLLFFGGYIAIIAGSMWLLEARGWNSNIASIGILPMAPIFVPFVRIGFIHLVLTNPLIPVAMAIMFALLLVVVVFTLKDRLRGTRRRRRDF